MNHSPRARSLFLASALATAFGTRAALAQDAMPVTSSTTAQGAAPEQPATPSPVRARDTSDAGVDHDRFCQTHWLAVAPCHRRDHAGPQILFGLDLGASLMDEGGPFGFGHGTGSVTDAGPAWGARVGVEIFSWLAVEGRYVGLYNPAQASVSPTGAVGLLTTGVAAVARFTAPFPYVHPYVFGGIGYYAVSRVGSSNAQAGSILFSSSQPGIPMGFGVDVPLTWHLSIGAEATYHLLLGEKFSNVTANDIDGGDFSTFTAVLRVRL